MQIALYEKCKKCRLCRSKTNLDVKLRNLICCSFYRHPNNS